MTGIAWKITKDTVWLMADTMISNAAGCSGEQSKIFPVLHANAMITMVGSPYALADWRQYLISAEVVDSLSELNSSATVFLRYLYPLRYQKHTINACHLYQFGLDRDGSMAGYVLKHPDFEPLKLEPADSDPHLTDAPPISNLEMLKAMIVSMKAQFPDSIGCSIQYANLQKGQFNLKTYHDFADRSNLLKAARGKLEPTTSDTIKDCIERHERYNRFGEWVR